MYDVHVVNNERYTNTMYNAMNEQSIYICIWYVQHITEHELYSIVIVK